MNNISLYFGARIFNSSAAAVEMAKKNPSIINMRFAENILKVKTEYAEMRLAKATESREFLQTKIERYRSLSDAIKSVKNIEVRTNYSDHSGSTCEESWSSDQSTHMDDESWSSDPSVHIYDEPESGDQSTHIYDTVCGGSSSANELIQTRNLEFLEEQSDFKSDEIDKSNLIPIEPDRTNFKGCILSQYDLRNRDFEGCIFFGANPLENMREMTQARYAVHDFSGSRLDGVDLRTVKLARADFYGASLIETQLSIDTKHNTRFNFSGANLENASIDIELPHRWEDRDLDQLLNNRNHNPTLFKIINSIEDEFPSVKTSMMRQIVESLEKCNVDIQNVWFPRKAMLNNLQEKEFYLQDPAIKKFIDKLNDLPR